jgi:hypothetical protein
MQLKVGPTKGRMVEMIKEVNYLSWSMRSDYEHVSDILEPTHRFVVSPLECLFLKVLQEVGNHRQSW